MTLILLSTLTVAFVAYEVTAKLVYRNTQLKTLSFVVRTWEGHHKTRQALITTLLVALWLHLVPRWF